MVRPYNRHNRRGGISRGGLFEQLDFVYLPSPHARAHVACFTELLGIYQLTRPEVGGHFAGRRDLWPSARR